MMNERIGILGILRTISAYLKVWENAPPRPDRSATRFVLLPLLPSGSDGVHRGPPCGARPGRYLGSTWVETGIMV